MGVSLNHPFYFRIFHEKNHPFWGASVYGNLHHQLGNWYSELNHCKEYWLRMGDIYQVPLQATLFQLFNVIFTKVVSTNQHFFKWKKTNQTEKTEKKTENQLAIYLVLTWFQPGFYQLLPAFPARHVKTKRLLLPKPVPLQHWPGKGGPMWGVNGLTRLGIYDI